MRPAIAMLVVALGATACEKREPEPAGIGRWRFNHLTLGNVTRPTTEPPGFQAKDGICQLTDLADGRKATWCFAQTPYKLGNRTAEVDAYFLGTKPDAPLIEVQLKVRGCVEDNLDQWLRQNYGIPIETKGNRTYWKNSFMWIAAIMPSDPGRCLVHMLPISEQGEIARIKAEGDPPPK